MTAVRIQPTDNGPFIVEGEINLADGVGKQIDTKDQTYLCRCGLSTNQPFCNGAHEGKFNSVVRSK